MLGNMKSPRRRIPKLSPQPEKATGRYYTSYRNKDGQPRRKRFTRDHDESLRLYEAWVRDYIGQSENSNEPVDGTSWPGLATQFLHREQQRVRLDDISRPRGTISMQEYENIERMHKIMVDWARRRWGHEKVAQTPLDLLVQQSDYEDLLLWLAKDEGYSDSRLRKFRFRFWELVRFARRKEFGVHLSFDKDDVRRYEGAIRRNDSRDVWLPTKPQMITLLRQADLRERTWIWMAIGLGFGNQDIARSKPCHFDKEGYDLRRGKTGIQRYGKMWPQVWAHIEKYLKEAPRPSDELLFVTRNGLPLTYARNKTPEEIANGTRTHGPKAIGVVYGNSLYQSWKRLLKKSGLHGTWEGGFYRLRSLGATVFAHRRDVGILDVRTFLGHADSKMSERYMKPLRPEIKEVVEWLRECLDSDDLDYAFRDPTKEDESQAAS